MSAAIAVCGCTNQPINKPVGETPDTAEEHLMQAQRYKQAGRIELCRASLLNAIKTDENSHAAKLAREYLKLHLPKEPITLEAEQRSVIGYNQNKNGDIQAAKKTFSNLIKDYPNFEWPYANLATIYVKEHNLDEAERLLNKALSINPDYANARGLLLKLQSKKTDALKQKLPADQLQPD